MRKLISDDPQRPDPPGKRAPQAPEPGASARRAGPTPAQALALQRQVGNRTATRTLARWTKHPDPEQKGVIVPDSVAEELLRFNPPKNQ